MTELWRRPFKNALCIISAWLLMACSPPEQAMFTEYNSRLARVLDIPLPPITTEYSDWPLRSRLTHNIPDLGISFLEFLALPDCGIKHLVSQRNEILAKHMNYAAKLHYEMAFIQRLDRCLDNVNITINDKNKLNLLLVQKKKNLILHFDNMIYSEPELFKAFKPAHSMLKKHVLTEQTRLEEGLRYLIYLKKSVLAIALSDPKFEINVQVINLNNTQQAIGKFYNNVYLAQITRSLITATSQLRQATELLSRVNQLLACDRNVNKKQLVILKNVFFLFFIEKQQPYITKINNYYNNIYPLTSELFKKTTQNTLQQKVVVNFYQVPHHMNLKQETKKHALSWKELFNECNITTLELKSQR